MVQHVDSTRILEKNLFKKKLVIFSRDVTDRVQIPVYSVAFIFALFRTVAF